MAPAIPYIALAATAVSTGVAIQQQEQAKKAEKKSSKARASALAADAARERERARRLASAQTARFGAAGVTQAGTPTFKVLQGLFDSIDDQEAILAGARNALEEGRLRARAIGTAQIGTAARGIGSIATSDATSSLLNGG